MSARYRAVAIDVDGTLLHRGRVSPANLACITALRARGVEIIIATGRPIEFLRSAPWAPYLPGPAIVLGGAVTYASIFGLPLSTAAIPKDDLVRLLTLCRSLGAVERIVLDGLGEFHATPEVEGWDAFAAMYSAPRRPLNLDEPPTAPILSVMLQAREHRRALLGQLEAEFAGTFHFTYFEDHPYIKVGRAEAHKGSAVKAVCKRRGIRCEELIALGDGANDLEMFACAGMAIAMSNGDPQVKALAHRIAPNEDGEGVAAALGEIFGLSP